MTGLLFANDATVTTDPSTSSGTTAPAGGTSETWTVLDSSQLPAVSTGGATYCHIADESLPAEKIKVTNINSATSITVTRGDESTTPVAHGQGATFATVITAGDFGSFTQH